MRVEIIEPHGFCSGVKGAIEKARSALSSGGTVWCLHELVHNETVVGELRETGGMLKDGAPARQIVSDDVTILRSGALKDLEESEIREIAERNLKIYDEL